MNKKTKAARAVGDSITYALLAMAAGLCVVGAIYAQEAVPKIISVATGIAFAGMLTGLAGMRIWFKRTYVGWIRHPVRAGIRGKPRWDMQVYEIWIEATIRFWKTKYARKDILKALDGLTIVMKPEPWKYMKRWVVGLASYEAIFVKYETMAVQSALAHELSHVIVGNIDGQWDEELSHRLMDMAGFSRDTVSAIVFEVVSEENDLVEVEEGTGRIVDRR